MNSRFRMYAGTQLRNSFAGRFALPLLLIAWLAPGALAKEITLTAIEIYDGPSGPAYVQLTDVLIDGKTEMRQCAQCAAAPIDKSTYGKLEKLMLAPGGTLLRGPDGALHYSVNNGPDTIVVPANVKFEHNENYSASQLADAGVLKGTPIGEAVTTTVPPLDKGVMLVFVVAPDVELAEYLRAHRADNIPGWQSYLSKYPASTHSANATASLAALIVEAGDAALNSYLRSAATSAPSYSDLKVAKAKADQARTLSSAFPPLTKLDSGIRFALSGIVEKARADLVAYHQVVNSRSPGYVHLLDAQKFAELVAGVDPSFQPGLAIQTEILQDRNTFQAAVKNAELARDARQFDQAFASITLYRAFAGEEPRVAALIDADYGYHLSLGSQAETKSDWETAIREYEKAGTIRDTPEAQDSLKHAREQLAISQDKSAFEKALASSKEAEETHDILRAYEVLANLPAKQRAQATDDLERLRPAYIESSSQAAKELRQAHAPIHGLTDEIGMQKAYSYLKGAYELSDNESFRDRMELIGNELSAYYFDQANRYFVKSSGSGTELGWIYLTEALSYKASNLDQVRDTMVKQAPAHAIRSKLSIRVQFRDQTSQRDSAGFVGQLENAIITGLEGSGIPVKVIRSDETAPVEPDFQLTGDVLQHHFPVSPEVEAVESKYRGEDIQVRNSDYGDADKQYQDAENASKTANSSLQDARAKKVAKKQITDLEKDADDAEKKAEAALANMKKINEFIPQPTERTYRYTRKTVNFIGTVKLQFRIADSLGGQAADLVPVDKEDRKQYVVLENVNPEDTQGVKATGPAPDPEEFRTALESTALDDLIAKVRKRVDDLPRKIYSDAGNKEKDADLDGAGESYLRYLEIVRGEDSEERSQARKFLADQFNIRPPEITQQ